MHFNDRVSYGFIVSSSRWDGLKLVEAAKPPSRQHNLKSAVVSSEVVLVNPPVTMAGLWPSVYHIGSYPSGDLAYLLKIAQSKLVTFPFFI